MLNDKFITQLAGCIGEQTAKLIIALYCLTVSWVNGIALQGGQLSAAAPTATTTEEAESPVFGVALSLAVDRTPSHDGVKVPVIVRECIDYIEEHGEKLCEIDEKVVCCVYVFGKENIWIEPCPIWMPW